ncbi:MAG: hypothetical protein HY871_04285 [Chloroflexi bacterium]|nr:hypothetical protein [Chloroflexota bacterium]
MIKLVTDSPCNPTSGLRVTSQDIWLTTLLFAALDAVIIVPLFILFKVNIFQVAWWSVVGGSALFWGVVSVVAAARFWDLYYRYIYPSWLRPLMPLDIVLYAIIGLVIWYLALSRLVGTPPPLAFALLGGAQGIAEHLFGIYVLRILDKVPWLQGVPPLPVIVFSFFEYVLYWTLVLWLALGLVKLGALVRG